MLLHIIHRTEYRYESPVTFGPHRLLVRPLEGHDVQIRSSALRFSPNCQVRWVRDLFDNCVAIAEPLEASASLMFESEVVVEQYNSNPFDYVLEPRGSILPVDYNPAEKLDLAHYLTCEYPDDQPVIREWLKPFREPGARPATANFLIALNKSVPLAFEYARREEPGVQTPAETLRLRSGSCRDFALLFLEAARGIGLAARFVTGYLCQGAATEPGIATGATHAWAELYLPGAGWKGFDPTAGVLAGHLHVRAGVARTPAQAAPIMGSFIGSKQSFRGMGVEVRVRMTEASNFP